MLEMGLGGQTEETSMANPAAPVSQAVLTRYAKALRAANIDRWRLIVRPDGEHEVIVDGSDCPQVQHKNDWD